MPRPSPTTDAEDRVELSSAAARAEAEVTRTDVVFDPAESAYRTTYLKGAETASGEGKSLWTAIAPRPWSENLTERLLTKRPELHEATTPKHLTR